METLLPSEIARLVLGYLHEQKCDEAVKVFLDTSPHLQECRTFLASGRRFSTKVCGMTLLDVLEKFSAVNSMIQERLSRISDCEQLKHCGDLLEQLKYIIEEPRGQRFVVNINVPTQANSQVSNSSPILSSSLRKRRYSNNERERNKRHKTPCSIPEQSDPHSNQAIALDNVEATRLETLPGHVNVQKDIEHILTSDTRNNTALSEPHTSPHSDKGTSVDINVNIETDAKSNSKHGCNSKNIVSGDAEIASSSKSQEPLRETTFLEKCTTSTSTEELLSFSCAEVQTTPYDTPESESETNDEPIENLSLLTKELLNRTELQERIAENINKAILPVDSSLKDDVLNSSGLCEANTSIMTEINYAIKSIVEATESDPVFENFLSEIIGPHNEAETSPDEESAVQTVAKKTHAEKSDPSRKSIESLMHTSHNAEPCHKVEILEVPLRDTFRNPPTHENIAGSVVLDEHCEPEQDQRALEDQNAAAIMSIINANITNSTTVEKVNTEAPFPETIENRKSAINSDLILRETLANNNNINTVSKKMQPAVKRIRPIRIKRDAQLATSEFISEQDILTMPTLIVCSKNEIDNMISTTTKSQANVICTDTAESSRFLPIASKAELKPEGHECIYLRTVQVPQKSAIPSIPSETSTVAPKQRRSAGESRPANVQLQTPVATITAVTAPTFSLPLPMSLPGPVPVPVPVPMTLTMPVPMSSVPLPLSIPVSTQPVCKVDSTMENINRVSGIEGITLYGKENSVKTTLNNTDVPMINVEETISLSGTGLSPYLKFSSHKTNANYSLSEIELTSVPEQPKSATLPKSDTSNAPDLSTKSEPLSKTDVITKHTPRTLLKSRSKNHRLSLSTPRRSSHVRALDFNTPAKSLPNRSASENEADGVSPKSVKHVKSVCRTSLFKSPPGVNNVLPGNPAKSPKLCTRKVPIATRSPRPKLMGGWDKYNGVGVIIGDISPQGGDENFDTVLEQEADNRPELKQKVSKGNWDADLRKVLQVTVEQQANATKSTNKNKRGPAKEGKVRVPSARKTKKASTLNVGAQSAQQQIQGNKIVSYKEPSISARDSETKVMPEVKQGIPKKKALVTSQTKAHTSLNKSEQKSAKKYVQLKTIKTSLKDKKDNEVSRNVEDKGSKVEVHPVKPSLEFQKMAIEITPQMLPISEIDLDTPRKFHNACGVPPTPRLLSPNSNTITPFVKISDDSSKLRSIISTPEFPNTPCVTFTPKHIQDSTQDNEKKDEFASCSPYYKPSCKQDENAEKAKAKVANLQSSSKTSSTGAVEITSHQTYTSARLEITQFEVIKENLPKEEAVKELKISTTSREPSTNLALQMHCAQNDASQHTMKNVLPDVSDSNSANKGGKCVDAHSVAVEKVCKGDDAKEDDDDTSSNSDTSDSESSTSSSSSGSSTTNVSSYSEEYAAFNKNRRIGGKLCTDIINNANQRCLRVTRSTVSEAAKTAQLEALKIKVKPPPNNDYAESKEEKSMDAINPQHPHESSPTKVFSLTKTDEQLTADMKETPAKDETLLNEADISETPSSSKNGVESLTNLSSKISALIGSETTRECPKANASADQPTTEKLKQKPKVLSIQTIPVACAVIKEQTNVEAGKLIVQLEEKRQRMIAKFREGTQTNVTRGRGNRRRTAFRGRRTGLNGLRRTCHPVATTSQYHCTQYINSNAIVEKNIGSNNNNTIATLVEDGKKTISSENSYLNSMSVSDNLEYDNVSSADETVEKLPEETQQVMEESKIQENDMKKDVELKPPSDTAHPHNPVEAGIMQELHSQKCQNTHTAQTVNESLTQKNVSSEAVKHTSAENLSRVDQTNCLFKSKVDQVKRDLFSDEENEHKGSSMTKSKTANDKSDSHISSCNSKPKELSHVLESLELVPASKNDEMNEMEDQDDNECIDTSVSNLFEYHFIYDESVPTKRRRRRYSNRDLEFHANIILTQDDNKECFKLMTPTDLEEILNISPKMKRRLPSKKPDKTVKPTIKADCSLTPCTNICTSKILEAKPLATSSPMEKPIALKIKKMPPKTQNANEKIKDTKADARKRIKSEKTLEIEKDNQDKKGRKRKLSESKESSQTEKKQNTTKPHLLLKNVDLNMFLTQVHGPE